MCLLPFLARCIGHLLQRDHDCLYIRFGAKPHNSHIPDRTLGRFSGGCVSHSAVSFLEAAKRLGEERFKSVNNSYEAVFI